MQCSNDCLITSCVLLALVVAAQVFLVAISYSSIDSPSPKQPTRPHLTINVSLSSRSLPSALIIGVRKGGTRALLDALALHPMVRVVRKETHFFDLNYDKGMDWYRAAMPVAEPEQIVIEKTPGYFTSKLAAKRVHHMNPAMKIIVIVRDPVQRTVSDFTQVFYNKMELNKSLPVFENEAFLHGGDTLNQEYKPIRNSIYHLHMANWLRYFSMEQILLVNGDVFRGNPISELRRVETFLDLRHEICQDQLIFNERKGFFCFLRSKRQPIKCLGSSKGRPHRNISQTTLDTLRRRFEEHNKIFFSQVNRMYTW